MEPVGIETQCRSGHRLADALRAFQHQHLIDLRRVLVGGVGARDAGNQPGLADRCGVSEVVRIAGNTAVVREPRGDAGNPVPLEGVEALDQGVHLLLPRHREERGGVHVNAAGEAFVLQEGAEPVLDPVVDVGSRLGERSLPNDLDLSVEAVVGEGASEPGVVAQRDLAICLAGTDVLLLIEQQPLLPGDIEGDCLLVP